MDATVNEIKDIKIKGFPTIKLFKRGSKNTPVDYRGYREIESIITFLKENTQWEGGAE